jgi:hypothetical protein
VRRELALGRDRAGDRVLRTREGEEEGVALRVDLLPAGLSEPVAQDSPVVAVDLAVPVAELLEKACRPFDVREEERDGSAGQGRLGHGG